MDSIKCNNCLPADDTNSRLVPNLFASTAPFVSCMTLPRTIVNVSPEADATSFMTAAIGTPADLAKLIAPSAIF